MIFLSSSQSVLFHPLKSNTYPLARNPQSCDSEHYSLIFLYFLLLTPAFLMHRKSCLPLPLSVLYFVLFVEKNGGLAKLRNDIYNYLPPYSTYNALKTFVTWYVAICLAVRLTTLNVNKSTTLDFTESYIFFSTPLPSLLFPFFSPISITVFHFLCICK